MTDLPGVTTNNEVEYAALISALVDLRGRIERAGKSLLGYTVVTTTGSQLLAGQLTQRWQAKADNLRSLVDEPAALVQAFCCRNLVKVPHDEILRVHRHSTEQVACQPDRA